MPKDNVVDFKKPEPFVDDPITAALRTGAEKLLAEALEAEIENLLTLYLCWWIICIFPNKRSLQDFFLV